MMMPSYRTETEEERLASTTPTAARHLIVRTSAGTCNAKERCRLPTLYNCSSSSFINHKSITAAHQERNDVRHLCELRLAPQGDPPTVRLAQLGDRHVAGVGERLLVLKRAEAGRLQDLTIAWLVVVRRGSGRAGEEGRGMGKRGRKGGGGGRSGEEGF